MAKHRRSDESEPTNLPPGFEIIIIHKIYCKGGKLRYVLSLMILKSIELYS